MVHRYKDIASYIHGKTVSGHNITVEPPITDPPRRGRPLYSDVRL